MSATILPFRRQEAARAAPVTKSDLVALINETADLWLADIAARAKLAKAREPGLVSWHAEYCKGPWPCDCWKEERQ